MAGPKERTQIDVGIKLWPRCRPELSVLRWTRRTTDGQRMSKFFPGDKSLSHSLLSAISSFALPSSARPCFPFSESDSPSPPSSLFARNLFGTYSPSVRTEGAKDGLGGEEEGEKWGKQKQPLREREPTKRPTFNTFSNATYKGSLGSGGLDLDPPLHKWLGRSKRTIGRSAPVVALKLHVVRENG